MSLKSFYSSILYLTITPVNFNKLLQFFNTIIKIRFNEANVYPIKDEQET